MLEHDLGEAFVFCLDRFPHEGGRLLLGRRPGVIFRVIAVDFSVIGSRREVQESAVQALKEGEIAWNLRQPIRSPELDPPFTAAAEQAIDILHRSSFELPVEYRRRSRIMVWSQYAMMLIADASIERGDAAKSSESSRLW
jgi:hypothetical protein